MSQQFDLVVIGTGTAASGVANRCRAAGWSVAVVDNRPYGGTCVLRGCDPKKVLRRAAEIVDAARLFAGKGIRDPGLAVDWPALMAFKRSFTEPVPESRGESFAEKGIATFHGTARFTGETSLAVGEETIEARRIVIASGAEPVPLPVEGIEHAIDSDAFLELEALPRRVLFVGGGYISFEFAHLSARAGAEVTMLDRGERPLTAFDADLVAMLVERTRALGVTFHAEASVEAIEKTDDGFRVHANIAGDKETFTVDLVVHGAGRRAALEALDLERGNVEAGKRGVTVNEHLQSTSNPAVYAAGDAAATAGAPLTPMASLEARIVAANLIDGNHATPDYTGAPSVVFTIPELVRVGLTEAEAQERGLDVTCTNSDMRGWYFVRRVGETHAAAKVLTDSGSGAILGAHILGPEASELINIFGLAMRSNLTAGDIKDMISAYPSAGSNVTSML